MAANPPRFRTHYVPPAGYNPDPDCYCPLCVEPEAPLLERRPPLGPPMVWRDVTCPSCRRVFCKVLAVADVRIIPHCEGCEREGR